MISLALAIGDKTPADLIDIYTAIGERVFYPDNEVLPVFGAKWTLGLDALKREIKDIAGDRTLADLKRQVVVTTFELHDATARGADPHGSWGPAVFTNVEAAAAPALAGGSAGPRIRGGTDPTPLFDVALSTSAAPTYFPTHGRFIDGGVVANNPALVAVAVALSGVKPPALSDIYVLSLGTGAPNLYVDVDSEKDWGYVQWVAESQDNVGREALIQVILDSSQDLAAFIGQKLIGPDHFFRANPVLADAIPLDAPQFRQTLLDAATGYYATHGQQLRDWVDRTILS